MIEIKKTVRNVKALLLAGGLGTRLRPLTDEVPKCLVPIGGRPLLDYWFDNLASAGVEDVLINNHHLPDRLRRYIRDVNGAAALSVQEAYEPVLLGSAGTITANRGWVRADERCLIIYADNLSGVDLAALLDFHAAHPDPVTMLLFRSPHPQRCGIAELDPEGRVVSFVEKPERPASNLANAGVYVVDGEAYREMADMGRFDLGFDVLPAFVGRMRGWVWDGYHRDIGTLESLRQAEIDAANVCIGGTKGTLR